MPSLNGHEIVTLFMEFSVNGKKQVENIPYKNFVNVSIALLRSRNFNFLRAFQSILILTIFIQMPFLHRHERVTRFIVFIVIGKKISKFFL